MKTNPEFDTTHIPDDARQWNALAERIAATAALRSKSGSLEWLATSRAGWVGASLLLVAALAMMNPAESSPEQSVRGQWAEALAPADDVGKAILSRDSPPEIAALVLGEPRGGKR